MKILKMLLKVLMGVFGFLWTALWFVLDFAGGGGGHYEEPSNPPHDPEGHGTSDGLHPDSTSDYANASWSNQVIMYEDDEVRINPLN